MVKRFLGYPTSKEQESGIGKALGEHKRISLHKIKSGEAIRDICREVISRVETHLAQITPERLELLREQARKKMKQSPKGDIMPIEVDELDVTKESVHIREAWDSERWKKHAPHGWAWRESEKKDKKKKSKKDEIMALIYQTGDKPVIFLDREILAHPHQALELIKNINKRHKALIAGEKRKALR